MRHLPGQRIFDPKSGHRRCERLYGLTADEDRSRDDRYHPVAEPRAAKGQPKHQHCNAAANDRCLGPVAEWIHVGHPTASRSEVKSLQLETHP